MWYVGEEDLVAFARASIMTTSPCEIIAAIYCGPTERRRHDCSHFIDEVTEALEAQ